MIYEHEYHHLPHPINEAEIIYADVAPSRLSALANIIGGVMRPNPNHYIKVSIARGRITSAPASMARACWKPVKMAKARGSSASSAKNGGGLLERLANGNDGRHSQA